MNRFFIVCLAMCAGFQMAYASHPSTSPEPREVFSAYASQPGSTEMANLVLQWEGPGGVILMLNNAEYVAQSGSTNEVEVPMNKALKVCIKKPFETLCAEYYLIVSEKGGLLRISEKAGRANFEFLTKEQQQNMNRATGGQSPVGMQGTLKPRE